MVHKVRVAVLGTKDVFLRMSCSCRMIQQRVVLHFFFTIPMSMQGACSGCSLVYTAHVPTGVLSDKRLGTGAHRTRTANCCSLTMKRDLSPMVLLDG